MVQKTKKDYCFQTVHQNGYEQDPYAKEFGINISEKLTSVEARVLPAPWVGIILCHVIHFFFSRLHYFIIHEELLIVDALNVFFLWIQLKYHDTGKEKECLPQVGQWNMVNKVQSVVHLMFGDYGV